jgi:DNA-binding response OmpR family regulator
LQYGNSKSGVLIVEDNPDISKYLEENLGENYTCIKAADGIEALECLEKNEFDLIISDVMMPNMDGFEFRKKVKENIKWKQIPFIMLTARALEEDRIAGFRLGID